MKACKDCLAENPVVPKVMRPIVEKSGGRCATHWRKEKARRKKAAHEKRVQNVYGLSDGDYDALYIHQGGRCALCQRAKGLNRRLAVDHDHETGLVYGLLCAVCNKDVMGTASRRDIAYFVRCIQYLQNPPARQLHITAYHKESRDE